MAKALKVPAVRVKITIRDIDPPVWRELVVPGHWHLGMVHRALQIAFGWHEAHLHSFQVGDRRYGEPDPNYDSGTQRESLVRVHEVLAAPGDVITYWYDFGDDWFHDIVVEELLDPQKQARCLDGRRAAPPEDSGGPWGYQDLLQALADPKHEEHEDRVEWVGEGYDPELVDIQAIDGALRRLS